jgi:hypothetical protein
MIQSPFLGYGQWRMGVESTCASRLIEEKKKQLTDFPLKTLTSPIGYDKKEYLSIRF